MKSSLIALALAWACLQGLSTAVSVVTTTTTTAETTSDTATDIFDSTITLTTTTTTTITVEPETREITRIEPTETTTTEAETTETNSSTTLETTTSSTTAEQPLSSETTATETETTETTYSTTIETTTSSTTADQPSSSTSAITTTEKPVSTSETSTTPSPTTSTTESETTSPPTSIATVPTTSVTSVIEPAPVDNRTPLGCYASTGGFQGFQLQLTSSLMTVDLCLDACQGRDFAGTHDQQCYCGDDIDPSSIRVLSTCDVPCPGNPLQKCGGIIVLNSRALEIRQSPLPTILLSIFVVVNRNGSAITTFTTIVETSDAPPVTSPTSVLSTAADTTLITPGSISDVSSDTTSVITSVINSGAPPGIFAEILTRPNVVVWSTQIVTEPGASRPTNIPQTTQDWSLCIQDVCEWDLIVLQPRDCNLGCDGYTLFALICDGCLPGEERWEPIWCFDGNCSYRKNLYSSSRCLEGRCGDWPIVEEAACDSCEGGTGYKIKPKDSTRGHRKDTHGQGGQQEESSAKHPEKVHDGGPGGYPGGYTKQPSGGAVKIDIGGTEECVTCGSGTRYPDNGDDGYDKNGHVVVSGSYTAALDTTCIVAGIVAGLVPIFVVLAI